MGVLLPIEETAGGAPAPPGLRAPPGTLYHWYILAHERVRKIDEDAYATLMSGVKHMVAHRRPYWRRWSCECLDQASERERILRILEDAGAELRELEPAVRTRI